eukprot:5631180-Amphidinium_carterae.1
MSSPRRSQSSALVLFYIRHYFAEAIYREGKGKVPEHGHFYSREDKRSLPSTINCISCGVLVLHLLTSASIRLALSVLGLGEHKPSVLWRHSKPWWAGRRLDLDLSLRDSARRTTDGDLLSAGFYRQAQWTHRLAKAIFLTKCRQDSDCKAISAAKDLAPTLQTRMLVHRVQQNFKSQLE